MNSPPGKEKRAGLGGEARERNRTGRPDLIPSRVRRQPPDQLDQLRAAYLAGRAGKRETVYESAVKNGLSPVADLLDVNAVLFLWVTSPLLSECWPIVAAWWFAYKSSFVWDKGRGMPGNYNHVRHEFLLVCMRGSCIPDVQQRPPSVQAVKRSGRHSEKPEEFRALIDQLYPHGKRLELFSRTKAKGWEAWGNES